jgi:FtsZ-binding cell division protein ZapB
MSTTQMRTALVVLLTDLTVHGDVIPEKTVIEVERSIRNDWFGSKLCRDATVEEIAEYRGQELAADGFDEQLQLDQAQLLADIEAKKGDLATLQESVEQLTEARTGLQAEVDDLGKQKKALADEVAALEKAKKAAGK